MQKTLVTLVLVFAVAIVVMGMLPLETKPPSPRWHHYVLVVCFFGSALSTLFLSRWTNRVGKLFAWLYLLIMTLMGALTTHELVDLLTKHRTGY